jgi:sterol desaturase/sphingolipid hydroxylase (fatty acid hydroxylase superfamily)
LLIVAKTSCRYLVTSWSSVERSKLVANVLEQKINDLFGDADSTGFGTGWWSGVLSAFFGFLSFGAVLCLHFPQLLSSPELRPHYPMHTMRLVIQGLIVAAILFGVISSILRKKKILALTGMLLAIAATAFGGSSVPINDNVHGGLAIGLDWFLLDMLLMALIYVPLERLWPQYPQQGTFRNEWTLDVVYFMSTHLPLQILSFLVLLPATQATRYLGVPVLQHAVARLPWLLQFFLAVVVADVAEYFIHLALHKVPWLWRFHAVHHSSKALDWIAGSRSHFVDDTLVRGFILVPLMLGFSQTIILAYLIFVTLHATWTHCNFGPNARWLEQFLVMPRYHHWHHTSQKEGIDKNFAIHFPWIDKLFGTYYFPKEWPQVYGLDGEEISRGFFRQTIAPFTRRKRTP